MLKVMHSSGARPQPAVWSGAKVQLSEAPWCTGGMGGSSLLQSMAGELNGGDHQDKPRWAHSSRALSFPWATRGHRAVMGSG